MSDLRIQIEKIISGFGLACALYGINFQANRFPNDPTDDILEAFKASLDGIVWPETATETREIGKDYAGYCRGYNQAIDDCRAAVDKFKDELGPAKESIDYTLDGDYRP